MHRIEIAADLDIDGNLTADYRASFVGNFESNYRGYWENQPAESRGIVMQNWMSYLIPGSEVMEFELQGVEDMTVPFEERVKLFVESYPTKAADLWIVKVPEIERDYTFEEVSLAKRRFAIEYTAPEQLSHHVAFKLPEGVTVEFLPEDISLDNPYASYEASYRTLDGRIIFEDIYRLKKRVVPPEDYAEYKDFCIQVSRHARKQMFLRR